MGDTLTNFIQKQYKILFIIGVLLIAGVSYYIGLQEGLQRGESRVALSCDKGILDTLAIPTGLLSGKTQPAAINTNTTQNNTSSIDTQNVTGKYVGSRNGKKYYTVGCSGTKRIKPANLIYFKDIQDAQLQGYSKGSC
ncbi:MAG: hypothetical protein WCQ32_02180 [bacterium]